MRPIQGANTMIPHRPQTTDGTTARRSITYTIGRDHRYGTTSVRSRATPTLAGTAMMIAITAVTAVPYMKASAPNWLAAGFQVLEKTFTPSVLNHDEACWVVEMAIRIGTASTSRQSGTRRPEDLSAPGGRRSDSAGVDPAGSTRVTALTTTSRPDL